MVLAAVDDLLFSSKIRQAAKQLGVPIVFARTPEDILEQARTHKPVLAIFDLNSQRTRPVETIAALKSETAGGDVRTVGFVAHERIDLIAAARDAGADEVLARGAFAARLPEILAAAGTQG
jgi:DNA-binding NarL/FixJ family response regulator